MQVYFYMWVHEHACKSYVGQKHMGFALFTHVWHIIMEVAKDKTSTYVYRPHNTT